MFMITGIKKNKKSWSMRLSGVIPPPFDLKFHPFLPSRPPLSYQEVCPAADRLNPERTNPSAAQAFAVNTETMYREFAITGLHISATRRREISSPSFFFGMSMASKSESSLPPNHALTSVERLAELAFFTQGPEVVVLACRIAEAGILCESRH